jgi:hypothetical protein
MKSANNLTKDYLRKCNSLFESVQSDRKQQLLDKIKEKMASAGGKIYDDSFDIGCIAASNKPKDRTYVWFVYKKGLDTPKIFAEELDERYRVNPRTTHIIPNFYYDDYFTKTVGGKNPMVKVTSPELEDILHEKILDNPIAMSKKTPIINEAFISKRIFTFEDARIKSAKDVTSAERRSSYNLYSNIDEEDYDENVLLQLERARLQLSYVKSVVETVEKEVAFFNDITKRLLSLRMSRGDVSVGDATKEIDAITLDGFGDKFISEKAKERLEENEALIEELRNDGSVSEAEIKELEDSLLDTSDAYITIGDLREEMNTKTIPFLEKMKKKQAFLEKDFEIKRSNAVNSQRAKSASDNVKQVVKLKKDAKLSLEKDLESALEDRNNIIKAIKDLQAEFRNNRNPAVREEIKDELKDLAEQGKSFEEEIKLIRQRIENFGKGDYSAIVTERRNNTNIKMINEDIDYKRYGIVEYLGISIGFDVDKMMRTYDKYAMQKLMRVETVYTEAQIKDILRKYSLPLSGYTASTMKSFIDVIETNARSSVEDIVYEIVGLPAFPVKLVLRSTFMSEKKGDEFYDFVKETLDYLEEPGLESERREIIKLNLYQEVLVFITLLGLKTKIEKDLGYIFTKEYSTLTSQQKSAYSKYEQMLEKFQPTFAEADSLEIKIEDEETDEETEESAFEASLPEITIYDVTDEQNDIIGQRNVENILDVLNPLFAASGAASFNGRVFSILKALKSKKTKVETDDSFSQHEEMRAYKAKSRAQAKAKRAAAARRADIEAIWGKKQ